MIVHSVVVFCCCSEAGARVPEMHDGYPDQTSRRGLIVQADIKPSKGALPYEWGYAQHGYASSTCRMKDSSDGAARCSLNSTGTAKSLPTESLLSAYTMDSPSDAGPNSRRSSHQTLAPSSLQQYCSYLYCTLRIIRVLHTVFSATTPFCRWKWSPWQRATGVSCHAQWLIRRSSIGGVRARHLPAETYSCTIYCRTDRDDTAVYFTLDSTV